VASRLLLPCRDICEEARACEPDLIRALNTTWPAEWNCNSFEYYTNDHKLCVINNQKESQPNSESDQTRNHDMLLHPTARYIDPSKQQTTDNQLRKPSMTATPVGELSATDANQASSIMRSNPVNQPQQQLFPPMLPHPESDAINPSVCDNGFFDCQLSDPKRPLCIEMKYVCDGKRDCLRNDSIYELNGGLDEMNCPKRLCADGQFYCDDKCISRQEICDGKADCSLGVDEQDCFDTLTGLIQSILCISVVSSAVFIVVKFLKADDDELNSSPAHCVAPPGETSADLHIPDNHSPIIMAQDEYKQPQPLSKMMSPLEQQIIMPSPRSSFLNISPHTNLPQEPMYQEVSTRGESIYNYERVLPGGHSGASSIYASGSYFGDEPVAPPPTRSATPIYQTSPLSQEAYFHMKK